MVTMTWELFNANISHATLNQLCRRGCVQRRYQLVTVGAVQSAVQPVSTELILPKHSIMNQILRRIRLNQITVRVYFA